MSSHFCLLNLLLPWPSAQELTATPSSSCSGPDRGAILDSSISHPTSSPQKAPAPTFQMRPGPPPLVTALSGGCGLWPGLSPEPPACLLYPILAREVYFQPSSRSDLLQTAQILSLFCPPRAKIFTMACWTLYHPASPPSAGCLGPHV